jgi:Raf kinase inhibitor-like YbhB/YbcL family protein
MPCDPGRVLRQLCLPLVVMTLAACSGGRSTHESATKVHVPHVITVTSDAFGDGRPIPRRFTCHGDGTSPPLEWRGVPKSAKAVALVVDDPDAPDATFVHWVVLDMRPTTTGIDKGSVPPGAVEAQNGAGDASYTGPCPPSGTHHYRFTVYALNARTGLDDGVATSTALRVVREAATAQGRLVGTRSGG